MNLFLSFMTGPAPSANYRGESEQNRTVLQKILIGEDEFPVISPEALRNALREMLALYGLPCNRRREHNEDQLAVSFADFPDPTRYIDDFLFGYMVVNREQIPKDRQAGFDYKRDSVIRNNLAVGLTPYRDETLFTQAPKTVNRDQPGKKPAWSNAGSSQLLHREMAFTSYQYPVALNLADFDLGTTGHALWLSQLLRAFSELNGVAGNAARSYFEMAPVSAIARVTPSLASGFPLYPFAADGGAPKVISLILAGHKPGQGFHLGGEILETLAADQKTALVEKGAKLHDTAEQLLACLSQTLSGRSFEDTAE